MRNIKIKKGLWKISVIFKLIQEKGSIFELEMMRIFNYGIGLVLISDDIIKIGEVIKGDQIVCF